jgi:hypothetical protein
MLPNALKKIPTIRIGRFFSFQNTTPLVFIFSHDQKERKIETGLYTL